MKVREFEPELKLAVGLASVLRVEQFLKTKVEVITTVTMKSTMFWIATL